MSQKVTSSLRANPRGSLSRANNSDKTSWILGMIMDRVPANKRVESSTSSNHRREITSSDSEFGDNDASADNNRLNG